MTFLEQIFARLERASAAPVLAEVRDGSQIVSVTSGELLEQIQRARSFIAASGLRPGDRCAIYAPNSIRWVALDLALMSAGVIVVPIDPRQVATEIGAVLRDSAPSLVCCADATFAANAAVAGNAVPSLLQFDEIFADSRSESPALPPMYHADHDAVTIIYTSGTSGEPKGVVLTARNITFMLGCANARLHKLMGLRTEPERVFQYAPFCFAAARILLLTSLSRNSLLTLSTDLNKLSEELKLAAPHYFVNVPIFLERVRRKVEDSIRSRGGFAAAVYSRALRAYLARARRQHDLSFADSLSLRLAKSVMFPAIRKSIGPNLKALICGSAPLAPETQLFFMMLGIPVLQVYGLTETTAICTMDDPAHPVPGRVGPAVPGIEMMLGENDEILVRGPNVFPGYWQRPADTAKALAGGWFHTGDQGEVDASGNWRITGRLKNLIVLNSGHNVAPEPLEHELAAHIPDAQQVVLVGNQRSFLSALVAIPASNGASGAASNAAHIQSVLDAINAGLPHYKQIRAFCLVHEPFSIENGLLTTMGKLKRDAIAARFSGEIEALYRKKSA